MWRPSSVWMPPGCTGRGAHTTLTVPPVEGNSEEDIRRLRSAVGNEGLIGRPFKVGILEIDVGVAVTGRRQVDQPSSGADKRRDAVNERKVAQVIGAELCFEAVGGMAKRCGHHARIGDDHVEGFTLCEQFVGTRAHAFEAGEIELNEPEAPTAGCCVFSHLHGRGFGLRQIPRRTHNLRAVRGKRPRSLHAEPGRDTRDEDPFAVQIDTGQNVLCR